MAGISFRAAALVALLAAAAYQTILRDAIIKVGIGRRLQPIHDFPYQCRRITHDGLQGCESMWFDEANRQLYLACSSNLARQNWLPQLGRLNASGRHTADAIFVLDIDKPVGDSYELRKLATPAFHGTAGEGELHGLALTGRKIPGRGQVELYVVNNKPSLSNPLATAGGYADNTATGANTTIELFEVDPGSSSMKHIRTFAHPVIASPNHVAPTPDGSGFYISNDHGLHKAGLVRLLIGNQKHAASPFLFTGNVVHCSVPPRDSSIAPDCQVVATGLSFPNGLAISASDPKVLYVPSVAFGKGISIFRTHPGGRLTKLEDLSVPFPLDNLSPSSDGSIYAAALPKLFHTLNHFEAAATYDPSIDTIARISSPATVLKINKLKNMVNDGNEVTWTWEKVLEDADGQMLPTVSTALKDARTGRLFMSGLVSYFITVCDPQQL